jgi:4-hydroxybenzoate polyprenyltransferase
MTQSQDSLEPAWLTVVRLLRWHKPAGRLILMIPALWAVFLAAGGKPPLPLVGVIILGTLATSGAGCVINDLWDRDIDPQVERTSDRPIASRTISVKTGIIILIIGLICAAILALYLNPLSYWLCVAAVPLIIGYPLAKRFFPIPQLVLAIAWGFAVLISWTAVTAKIDTATWLLWGATVLWTLGFDTVYAMSDKEDDLKIGINSSAIFFGDRAPEAVGIFFAGTAVLMVVEAIVSQLGAIFWVFWLIAAIGWTRQYLRLRDKNLPRVVYGEIFAQNVWLGFILLLGVILGSILSV